MSDDQGYLASTESLVEEDGRSGLAMGAGLVAALAGGAIWAAIAIIGHLEIGWAAWGVGALVGGAMTRVTTMRGKSLQLTAALLAAVGLLLGKAFIVMGSARAMTEEVAGMPDVMTGAIAWKMHEERALDAATLDSVDATQARGDTLSDALWQQMTAQAAARLPSMTETEKQEIARAIAEATIERMGIVGGITAQLGPWDLLWFGLALATAYRMLATPTVAPAAPQPEEQQEET